MKNAKILSRIASLGFVLSFLLYISADIMHRRLQLDFESILWWGILLSMAILLLINKRSIGFPLITGINALRYLYITRSFWKDFSYYPTTNKVVVLCFILSNVTLFVIFLISMIRTTYTRNMINELWFIPGIIQVVGCLFYCWWTYSYYNDGFHYDLRSTIAIILTPAGEIFYAIACVLSCLWIKTVSSEDKKTVPDTLSNIINEPEPTLGGADKLLQYKELLDLGIITQEEFDEKKNQVLGI